MVVVFGLRYAVLHVSFGVVVCVYKVSICKVKSFYMQYNFIHIILRYPSAAIYALIAIPIASGVYCTTILFGLGMTLR